MPFSDIIKAKRKALGLTQHDLADKLRVSQRYISAIEAGISDNPTLETIREFAEALGLEASDLEPLLAIAPKPLTSATSSNTPEDVNA